MNTTQTVEAALRARIAQLEADVIYIRGLCERANEDAAKADAQNERLREERDELVEVLRQIDSELGERQTLALTRILKDIVVDSLKKYEQ